jgi:hypothetical protein
MNISLWQFLDFLSLEWVEDWGSGLLALCVVLLAYVLPMVAVSRKLPGRWLFVTAGACAFLLVTLLLVHNYWNGFQIWYTSPLDPSWQPVTPENWRPLLSG